MSSSASDAKLNAWVEKLSNAPLPVFAETVVRMKRIVHGGNESMRALARTAARDPAFGFHVFRESNALVQKNRNVFYDLEHAMSMLGLQKVRALIEHVPVIPDAPSNWSGAYQQQLAVSHHAGLQTRGWLEYRKRASPYEAQWMATLRTAPLWAISRLDPKAMQTLNQLFLRERRALPQALDQLFGCSFAELSLALFRHWKLERFITPLLEHETQCPPRVLVAFARLGGVPRAQRAGAAFPHRVLLNDNLTFAVVANLLALHSAQHWFSRGTLRAERAAAGLLNLDLPSTVKMIHYGSAGIARSLSGIAGGQPASGLLDTVTNCHRPAPMHKIARTAGSPDKARSASAAPASQSTGAVANPAKLRKALLALRACATGGGSVPGILSATLDGVAQGAGLPRVMIFTKGKAGGIQLRLQAGLNENQRKTLATLPGDTESDLFRTLLQKPAAVLTTGTRGKTMLSRLPARVTQAMQPVSFCACSLAFRGKAAVLVYADSGSGGADIVDATYKAFRQVCNVAGDALEKLSA